MTEGIHVPDLWHLEVGNPLPAAAPRNRITAQERSDLVPALSGLSVTTEALNARRIWESVTPPADRHGLSLYDAASLEMAVRKKLPPATYDKALGRAAAAHQVLFAAKE